jgi:hypothetical protein
VRENSLVRRFRQWLRDTLVVAGYLLLGLALVLLGWLASGHFRTAFRGRVDWPVRTGVNNDDAPVPAWLFYLVFPTVVLAMTGAQVAESMKRRRQRAAPWWDYTPDEIDAMTPITSDHPPRHVIGRRKLRGG